MRAGGQVPAHIAGRVGVAAVAIGLVLLSVIASVELAGQLRGILDGGGGDGLSALLSTAGAHLGLVSLIAWPVGAGVVFARLALSGEAVAWAAVGGHPLAPAGWSAVLGGAAGLVLLGAGQGPVPPAEINPQVTVQIDGGVLSAAALDRQAGMLMSVGWLGLGPGGELVERWEASRAIWTGARWVAQRGRVWQRGEEAGQAFVRRRVPPEVPGPESIAPDPRRAWPTSEQMASLRALGWDDRGWRRARALGLSLPLLLAALTLVGAGVGQRFSQVIVAALLSGAMGLIVMAVCVAIAVSP